MKSTWKPEDPPPDVTIGLLGWILVAVRSCILLTVLISGLALLLIVRLFERPIWGQQRPISPFITQIVCRICLIVLGIRTRVQGAPMGLHGALVSNHSSWLDIFVLNSAVRVFFVSKAEVSDWPGIGWLARATGTVFIRRNRQEARAHIDHLGWRLDHGHKLLIFPEGTSSDGTVVLPFKSTLFQPFLGRTAQEDIYVQPVSLVYHPPRGQDRRFYGWWGAMDFMPHAKAVMSAIGRGDVRVMFHTPLRVGEFLNRKEMAKACENAVRGGFNG